MKKLSAREVRKILNRNTDFRLINVLPEEHFKEKHVPNSVNIPLGKPSFLQRVEQLVHDKGAKVVVYCADSECNASPRAARELEEAGFENVHDFEGGVAEWEEAGFHLEGQRA
jgi:rhodanese-related sulfurtransferase